MTKMKYRDEWLRCCRAANRLADLVCSMYHPKDAKARQTWPTATWAEIIASELGIEIPDSEDSEEASSTLAGMTQVEYLKTCLRQANAIVKQLGLTMYWDVDFTPVARRGK